MTDPNPADGEVVVWLHADTYHPDTWDHLTHDPMAGVQRIVRAGCVEPGMVTLEARAARPLDAVDLPESEDHEVLSARVPAQTLTRWQEAAAVFAAAQEEMSAYLCAAEAENDRLTGLVREVEQARWRVDWERAEAAKQAAEARAEAEDGPREWVLVTKSMEVGRGFRTKTKDTGFAVHHAGCGYLKRISEPSVVGEPMRLPQAVDAVLDEPHYSALSDEALPMTVCSRCAGPVRANVEFLKGLRVHP